MVASPKSNAETVLITHKKDPLLAHWRYGLGKTVAFTSDAKPRWASDWLGWDRYARFWAQIVRWSLRSGQKDQFQVQTTVEGDRVKCVVDALTEDGGFLNELTFDASVIDPKYKTEEFSLRQVEPGRYVGYFPTTESGSYLMSMTYRGPDNIEGSLTSGVSIPYSPEHSSTQQNDLVLKKLREVGGYPFLSTDENVFEHNLQGDWRYASIVALPAGAGGFSLFLRYCRTESVLRGSSVADRLAESLELVNRSIPNENRSGWTCDERTRQFDASEGACGRRLHPGAG